MKKDEMSVSCEDSYCKDMKSNIDAKQDNGKSQGNTENKNGESCKEHHEYHTGRFGNQLEFWLSSLGYAIGYGNMWRFPYMLYKNGGGTFLIPWSICIVVLVLPVFYLETLYGQLMILNFEFICPYKIKINILL